MPARHLRIQLATIGLQGMVRLAWQNRTGTRLRAYEICRPLLDGRRGIEIGGPSAIFARTGHRFSAVINYDSSDIAPDMADEWFSMAADVERTCYDHVSRYTTSAFMRLKLGDALARRNVAPHIFETSTDAHQFVVD